MIRKRGKTYVVRVYDRGKQRWVGTFPTHRAARDAERDAYRTDRAPRQETVRSFAERWVRDYPRPKESTNRHYDYKVRQFARDHGSVALDNFDRPQARQWALEHPGNVGAVRAMFNDAVGSFGVRNPRNRTPNLHARKGQDG